MRVLLPPNPDRKKRKHQNSLPLQAIGYIADPLRLSPTFMPRTPLIFRLPNTTSKHEMWDRELRKKSERLGDDFSLGFGIGAGVPILRIIRLWSLFTWEDHCSVAITCNFFHGCD